MNDRELETAQQRFDRDMADAHGDPRLMHIAQARHNGRVWGAAMARSIAVEQHVEELDRLVAVLYARPEALTAADVQDFVAKFKEVEGRVRKLMERIEAQHGA
jgi:hypothetical protein